MWFETGWFSFSICEISFSTWNQFGDVYYDLENDIEVYYDPGKEKLLSKNSTKSTKNCLK